jgi:hypothetical protein
MVRGNGRSSVTSELSTDPNPATLRLMTRTEHWADNRWWDRWLPQLNQLLGRELGEERGTYDTPAEPRLSTAAATATWSSSSSPQLRVHAAPSPGGRPSTPRIAGPKDANEASTPVPHIWESVIRHVARALCALERAAQPEADPTAGILLQDHLTGPWLRTLRALTGQTPPTGLKGLKPAV